MTDSNRVAGTIEFRVNDEVYFAEGTFSYNAGLKKREELIGADKPHGYKEVPQVAMIEGTIRTIEGLDIAAFLSITNATVTLALATGQTVILVDAWQAAEGTGSTEDGTLPVKFCSTSEAEITVG